MNNPFKASKWPLNEKWLLNGLTRLISAEVVDVQYAISLYSQTPLHSVFPCMCIIDRAVFFSSGIFEKSLCTRPKTAKASGPLGLICKRFDLFFRISPCRTLTDIFVCVAKNDSLTSYDPSHERPIQSGHSS